VGEGGRRRSPIESQPTTCTCAPRLTNTQFSLEELSAIVEEAKAAGTYV